MAEAACNLKTFNIDSEPANCSVGVLINAAVDCHTVSKCAPSKAFVNISELSSEKLELLRWRTNLQG